MELKQIKDLMAAMGRTGTKRLRIQQEGFELELEREGSGPDSELLAQHFAAAVHKNSFQDDIEHHRVSATPARQEKKAEPFEEELNGMYVTSPMVGTFYTSPSPEDPHFVNVGDTVSEDTVICIVEAMKVMNEVKAGVSGTVAEVLMENGHPVEFGTKLFRIAAE